MNTDHVQCYTCELSCNNCGLAPTFEPMPAATLSDVIRGFLLMHRRCEKPVEPSKQVELFDALAAKEANLRPCGRSWCASANLCKDCAEQEDREGMAHLRGIDGMSDSPNPETDPPGPQEHDLPELTDQDDAFGRAYPMARDHFRLHTNLSVVLQGVLAPTMEQLKTLPVGSLGFDKIAHWTRLELARMNLTEHPELEVYLPTAGLGMPKELVAFRKELKAKEKPKRGARPLTQPKKRRSGADQHNG